MCLQSEKKSRTLCLKTAVSSPFDDDFKST